MVMNIKQHVLINIDLKNSKPEKQVTEAMYTWHHVRKPQRKQNKTYVRVIGISGTIIKKNNGITKIFEAIWRWKEARTASRDFDKSDNIPFLKLDGVHTSVHLIIIL